MFVGVSATSLPKRRRMFADYLPLLLLLRSRAGRIDVLISLFFRTIVSKMDCIIVSNTIAFRSRASLHHVHLVNYSLCPNSQRACESTHSIVAHSLVAHNTFCFILHSTFWRHVYASPGRHYCKMGMNGLNKTISMQYKATRMIICIIDKNSRQFHCTSFFFCS